MKTTATLVLGLLLLAGPASADIVLVPQAGVAFSGDGDATQVAYGGSLMLIGDGVLGFELDGLFVPEFARGDGSEPENNLTSLMADLVLGVPLGEGKLYAVAGVGLLKTRVRNVDDFADVDSNELGVNVGLGLLAFGGGRFGFRGDVRYVRSLQDPEPDNNVDVDLGSLNTWRATAGLAIRF
jgi:hypothetical protein